MENQNNFEDRLEEANILVRYREFPEACKIYEELISEGYESPELYNNYGLALFYLDEIQEALNKFNKAIELNSSFALPYANIGLIHLNDSQYEKAIEYLLKALEFDTSNAETHYNLAVSYYRMDKKIEALKHYEFFLKYAGEEYSKLKEGVLKIINQIKENQDNPKD